jgi:hypothetical protein
MIERHAAELKFFLESRNPDAGVIVEADEEGVEIHISGAGVAPGESVPGTAKTGDVTLSLRDGSVVIGFLLGRDTPLTGEQ